MKFLKGLTCFLLFISYSAIGVLVFSFMHHDFLGLTYQVNFMGALAGLLAIANVLHIFRALFTRCIYKRMLKENKFDNYVEEPFRGRCCGR